MEVHVKPFSDQDDFGGNGGYVIPWEEVDQREIKLGESVHARNTAQVQGDFARFKHARVSDWNAGELQREVAFDGGVYFRGAAIIDVPASVRQLHGKHVINRLAFPFLVD